jgi:hypothetical protein
MYRLSLLPRQGMHSNRKEMNALTGNKAALPISCSIDMNALTGNAQNHAARSTTRSGTDEIPVARPEMSGRVPESLHRSGEAPTYQVCRIHKTEPGQRIKQVSGLRRSGTCHGQSPTFRATQITSVPDEQILRNISE